MERRRGGGLPTIELDDMFLIRERVGDIREQKRHICYCHQGRVSSQVWGKSIAHTHYRYMDITGSPFKKRGKLGKWRTCETMLRLLIYILNFS